MCEMVDMFYTKKHNKKLTAIILGYFAWTFSATIRLRDAGCEEQGVFQLNQLRIQKMLLN